MKKIPKILHLYWDGSPMSYLCYLTVESFHYHNSDWKIRVYVPTHLSKKDVPWNSNEQSIEYTGIDYWDKLKKLPYVEVYQMDITQLGFPGDLHPVHQSDIFRWWIIAKEGGVWSDFDILYTKPIENLDIHEDVSCTFSYGDDGYGYNHFKVGFFMASPSNIYYSNIYQECKSKFEWLSKNDLYTLQEYQTFGRDLLMGGKDHLVSGRENKILSLCETHNDIHLLPFSSVYSVSWKEEDVHKIFFESEYEMLPDQSIGVHWYNGNPVSKKYINCFEQNKNNSSLISTLIKKYDGL